jgi:hypothetical protein
MMLVQYKKLEFTPTTLKNEDISRYRRSTSPGNQFLRVIHSDTIVGAFSVVTVSSKQDASKNCQCSSG